MRWGAKAARLIGRENIADGALIELIKNAYDADASCVCVWFDMPFPYVPTDVPAHRLQQILNEEDHKKVLTCYDELKSGVFHKKEELTEEENSVLRELFAKYNRLIVADNGVGMSLSDVKTKWMYIGTSDKEVNYTSSKGRIKTGAKGIGRFALDKFPKAFTDQHDWTKGTMIILSPIREEWSMRLFQKVNTNLKSINPLGTVDPFKVFVCNKYYPEYDYETSDVSISVKDYDYKIKVLFDGERKLTIKLGRNEVDVHKKKVLLKKYGKAISLDSFWARPYFKNDNCHREQYEQEVIIDRDMTKVLKDDPVKIRNVGSFKAELYFVKNQGSDAEIIKKVAAKSRKELLAKFSGVKIYRDYFKVRPYGDDGNYFDWLELGKRQADSPGGVGRTTMIIRSI